LIKKLKQLLSRYGKGRSAKSIHLAISQSFIALLFIFVDFVFSKQLTVANFGFFKEVFFILNLGIPLATFGIPEGYKYFIAKEKDYSFYFKNLTCVLFLIAAGILGFIGLLHLLHVANFIDLKQYFGVSFLFPLPLFFFILNQSLRYTYINLDTTALLTRLSAYGAVLSAILIFAITFSLAELTTYAVLLPVVIYSGIFGFPVLFYYIKAPVQPSKASFEWASVKKMLKYGFPLYLATFAGLLSVYLDKLIVSLFENEATFAIFAVGAFEIPLFAMLSAAFSQQIFPSMVSSIDKGNYDEAQGLWLQTTKKVSMITYPFIVICMFFADDIIYFMYSSAYEDSIILFKTYLLIALFRNNSYGILLTAKGETKIITIVSVSILGINLISSLVLYYFYGIPGIIYGSLISTLFMWSFYLNKEKMFGAYFREIIMNKTLIVLTILVLLFYFL
jgi:O-antigen/teichoic acid export membrane protein